MPLFLPGRRPAGIFTTEGSVIANLFVGLAILALTFLVVRRSE